MHATELAKHTGLVDSSVYLQRLGFAGLLATIIWLPIPLGSATSWGWSALALGTWCLTALTYMLCPQRSAMQLIKARPAIICWLLIVFWHVLQLIPLPPEWANLSLGASLVPHEASSSASSWRPLTVNVTQSELVLVQTLTYFALFMLILMLVHSVKRMIMTAIIIGVTGVFQVFYASFLLASDVPFSPIFDLPVTNKASGTYLQPEQYAYCLFVAICAMLGVLLVTLQSRKSKTTRARFRRLIMYIFSPKGAIRITVLILFVGLLLSQNIVAILTCSTGLVLIGLIAYKRFYAHSHRYAWFFGCLVAINAIVMSIGGNWALTDPEFHRHFSAEAGWHQSVTANAHAQTQTQTQTPQTAASSPEFLSLVSIFGSGAGTVSDTVHTTLNHWNGFLVAGQKNDLYQRIVEFGVVGAIVYIALIFISLRAAINALFRCRRASSNGIGFTCTAVIAGTIIISAFSHAMQAPANAAIFTVIMALAFTPQAYTRNNVSNLQD